MREKRENSGFALIAALLAIWILTAVGVLIFTVTTQDVRISSRMVGEKKAFFATEAGIHNLAKGFDPLKPNDPMLYNRDSPVDLGADPNSYYRIGTPEVPTKGPAAIAIPGYDAGWGATRFLATVTGTNRSYGSAIQVEAGVGFGPVGVTTAYR